MVATELAQCFFCCCGPKGSLCCSILSVWGFLMLLILGVFFRIQAVALFEDVEGQVDSSLSSESAIRSSVDAAYNNASSACFTASGLYLAYLVFSATMVAVNVFRAKAAKETKRR